MILVLAAAVPSPPVRTSGWRLLSVHTHLAGRRVEPILCGPWYQRYTMPLVCQNQCLLHPSSICLPAIRCTLLYTLSLEGETRKHKGCFLGCFWGRHKLSYEPDKSEMVALFCTGSGLKLCLSPRFGISARTTWFTVQSWLSSSQVSKQAERANICLQNST